MTFAKFDPLADPLDDDQIRAQDLDGLLDAAWDVIRGIPDGSTRADDRAHLDALDRLTARARDLHGPTPRLFGMRMLILGKQGRFDEALAEGRRAHAEQPSWETASTLAHALRRAGDADEAVAMFREAIRLRPEDLSVRLDIGDVELERERYAEALPAYEEVLSAQPGHPWAEPSACYCRYRLEGDRRWLAALEEMASPPRRRGSGLILTPFAAPAPEPDPRADRARELLDRVAIRW